MSEERLASIHLSNGQELKVKETYDKVQQALAGRPAFIEVNEENGPRSSVNPEHIVRVERI